MYSPSQNLGIPPEETARQHFLSSQATAQNLGMSPEEIACCQHAIGAAHSGKRQQAYELFCVLHTTGKRENVILLFWLAATTPFLEEAQRAMATIELLEPNHPSLPGSRLYVSKWQQKGASGGKDRRNVGRLQGFLIVGIIIAVFIFIGLITPVAAPRPPTVPEVSTETTTPLCSTQTCISPYGNSFTPSGVKENGFTVECRDGTYSHAGGRRGACSYHGGETSHP